MNTNEPTCQQPAEATRQAAGDRTGDPTPVATGAVWHAGAFWSGGFFVKRIGPVEVRFVDAIFRR